MLDAFIDASGDTTDPYEVLGARLIRGLAFEQGLFPGGVDRHRAWQDFAAIHVSPHNACTFATLGLARVMFDIDGPRYRDDIVAMCEHAIAVDGNRKAMLLLGFAREKLFDDHAEARRWYWQGFRRGQAWGIRLFACSLVAQGHVWRAVGTSPLAWAVAPIIW